MSILIETYRGVEINFEPEREKFTYTFDDSSFWDKQSFGQCKKSIDEWLKKNATFEPFYVMGDETWLSDGKKLKIVGIRKDNRFVAENSKGEKIQISEYDENNYIEYLPENEPIYAKVAILKGDIDRINKEIDLARKSLKGKRLNKIKEKYKQP